MIFRLPTPSVYHQRSGCQWSLARVLAVGLGLNACVFTWLNSLSRPSAGTAAAMGLSLLASNNQAAPLPSSEPVKPAGKPSSNAMPNGTVGVTMKPMTVAETTGFDSSPFAHEPQPMQHERTAADALNVVMVSAGRSGSTMLSHYFMENPRWLYLFEPDNDFCCWNCSRLFHAYMDGIEAFFNCSFAFDDTLLQKAFWWNAVRLTHWPRELISRLNNTMERQGVFLSSDEKSRVHRYCLSKSRRVLKSICFDTPKSAHALATLATTPHRAMPLKIIHLVRHPAAVIRSQIDDRWWEWCHNDVSQAARAVCKRMRAQIQEFEPLLLNSNVFMRVRYEDMARHQAPTIQAVAAFLHEPLSKSVQHEVLNSFTQQVHGFKPLSNLESRLHHWKQTFNTTEMDAIFTECGDVMRRLNFDSWPLKRPAAQQQSRITESTLRGTTAANRTGIGQQAGEKKKISKGDA
mmetsp:Transcript_3218/g.6079  ORF Transcript_3218/g.6079 Transcript_3218/m.6079 type:complete len:461 (+) Transcript_3218:187-1569(+)